MRSAIGSCSVALLLGGLSPAPASQVTQADGEVTAAQAVAFLNAQRAANGLPAGIIENPGWSDGCAKHAKYFKLNGWGSNPHDEDPSKPGYTPEGQQAARSSVLGGTYDRSGENPWESAPIHLMQLLGPGLAETGYAPGCMWTWPGYTRERPVEIQTFTYPGPGSTIYYSEVANELPFVPGDFVGLPAGTTTGPHLYVFAFGQQAQQIHLNSATLTGPTGSVAVRTVDNLTSSVGRYLPPGGIVIPEQPLAPDTEYRAVVEGSVSLPPVVDGETWTFGTTLPIHWEWTFRTRAAAVEDVVSSPRGLRVSIKAMAKGSRLRVDVDPNWRSGNYGIVVQRKRGTTWKDFRPTRTRGVRDRRTLRVPKGKYRVLVPAQRSRTEAKSKPIRLGR